MVTVVTDWTEGQQSTVRQDDSGLYASRSFLIKGLTGTDSTRLVAALAVTGIPAPGDAHPATGTLLARSMQPRLVKRDPQFIEVVVDYFRAGDSDYDPDNPATTDPVIIEFDYEFVPYTETSTATGAALNDRFTLQRSQVTYRISKSVTDKIEDLHAAYAGYTNSVRCRVQSGAATTWPLHTVRIDGFEGEVVEGRSVNRITAVVSVAGAWERTAYGSTTWGFRFPRGSNTAITGFTEIRDSTNLISSGFLVS